MSTINCWLSTGKDWYPDIGDGIDGWREKKEKKGKSVQSQIFSSRATCRSLHQNKCKLRQCLFLDLTSQSGTGVIPASCCCYGNAYLGSPSCLIYGKSRVTFWTWFLNGTKRTNNDDILSPYVIRPGVTGGSTEKKRERFHWQQPIRFKKKGVKKFCMMF